MAKPKWMTTLADAFKPLDDPELLKARGKKGDDDDEDDAPPSEEDEEQDAAPDNASPDDDDDGDGEGGDDGDGDDDDSDGDGGDDDDDEDDDDEDLRNRVIRRSQGDPSLLKSVFLEHPDLLKSLYEGEDGERLAQMVDASDTVAYMVDTFDRMLKDERKQSRAIVKSLAGRIEELESGLEAIGSVLPSVATALADIQKSVAGVPDILKSEAKRDSGKVGRGLGGMVPPKRRDPAQDEEIAKSNAARNADDAEVLTRHRFPVRQAIAAGQRDQKFSNAQAGELIGMLGTGKGIRQAITVMEQTDAAYFKSLAGMDDLIKAVS